MLGPAGARFRCDIARRLPALFDIVPVRARHRLQGGPSRFNRPPISGIACVFVRPTVRLVDTTSTSVRPLFAWLTV
jgi:hypothetical protein